MYQANFTIKQLFESGLHYGHKTNLWNPKMSQYIYGAKGGIHIIDLRQTFIMLNSALKFLHKIASNNGRILFVGTKRQAATSIANHAKRCGQYFVNYRWLGGMMTNWSTVFKSVKTLESSEKLYADQDLEFTKKERLNLKREIEKLDHTLGGIRNMGGIPDALLVMDTKENAIAVQEAKKLNIPVIAIVDTNTSFDNIHYVIPGNDDSKKGIDLICSLAADAILEGIEHGLQKSGVSIDEKLEDEVMDKDTDLQEVNHASSDKEVEKEIEEIKLSEHD
ncbi:MAG: 30S ribosomal protein S2 [Proteobacteria bacterium]|nr:30S ribosomal protein S2 [Pseudomonadota bacterium]